MIMLLSRDRLSNQAPKGQDRLERRKFRYVRSRCDIRGYATVKCMTQIMHDEVTALQLQNVRLGALLPARAFADRPEE